MKKCIQCQNFADIHISWLARVSETENKPQECDICNACMSNLYNQGFKRTKFGQTLIISDLT